jgi:tetratricopeptide (TPR) repeat protein
MPRSPARRRQVRAEARPRRASRKVAPWLVLAALAVGLLAAVPWLVPEPPARIRQQADRAARQGRWDEALRLWRSVNAGDAADARSWLGEARACLALGRAGQAERALARASRLDPADPDPWLTRLEILRVEDRQGDALRLGWEAYDAVPPGGRREILRALTLALLADTPDELARETLRRWASADPADLDALAALDRRMGEHPRADDPPLDDRAGRLERALAAHPGHAGLREALALDLANLGEVDRGRAALDAWPEGARDERYDRLRGRWDLEYDGRRDRALAAFDRALAALPHDWRTRYARTLALQRLGRRDEARAAAEAVGRLRDVLEPRALGPRLDADLARLDDPAALRDLAALARSAGLERLAAAWRAEATAAEAEAAARGLPQPRSTTPDRPPFRHVPR